jgi:phage baseplate assembly protein W
MATDAHLLTDVRLRLERADLRPVWRVASTHVPARGGRAAVDLAAVDGRDNLEQAIIVRLQTPVGELAALGHPDYGSRLHELIGSPNTEARRRLAKLHVLDALAREPRVEKITAVTVEPDANLRGVIHIAIDVIPAGATATLTIGPFVFSFEP